MSPQRTVTVEKVRAQLREIASDAARDAHTLDGQPFDGKTIAVFYGFHAAAIARLAEIVESLLPEEEPDRDPVPYVDYLPEMRRVLDEPAVAYDPEDPNSPKAGA